METEIYECVIFWGRGGEPIDVSCDFCFYLLSRFRAVACLPACLPPPFYCFCTVCLALGVLPRLVKALSPTSFSNLLCACILCVHPMRTGPYFFFFFAVFYLGRGGGEGHLKEHLAKRKGKREIKYHYFRWASSAGLGYGKLCLDTRSWQNFICSLPCRLTGLCGLSCLLSVG